MTSPRVLFTVVLLSLATSTFAAVSDLRVLVEGPQSFSRRGTIAWNVNFGSTGTDAPPAELAISLPPNAHLASADFYPVEDVAWTCTERGGEAVCAIPRLAPNVYRSAQIALHSDDAQGGYHPVTFTLRADVEDPDARNNSVTRDAWWLRPFLVTTVADDGPGSLRQTILDLNAQCGGDLGCEVLFALPLDAPPVTIEPLSPLPAITGSGILLDADATEYPALQTNLRVAIDGRNLDTGNGLEIRPRIASHIPWLTVDVQGLAVGNFPDNGVAVVPEVPAYIHFFRVYSGTDVTGGNARPNRARGFAVNAGSSVIAAVGCIASGNARSGMFISDVGELDIDVARIGVARDGITPLPNGASGIYVERGRFSIVSQASIIAYNAHFGVALQPGVTGAVYGSVYENGGGAIDWGLDGPTPNRADDSVVPNKPRLTEAFYDAATNETVVRGTLPLRTNRYATIGIFANDGEAGAEMQRPLGGGTPRFGETTFDIRVRGDLRGKTLTAVAYDTQFADYPSSMWRTSEVSEGLPVT
jgi:hypothetical protein